MFKLYAKKREAVRAVQWLGGKTPELVELLGQHGHYNADSQQLELGNGWYARVGDWILSASGEDVTVIGDEVFRKIYEEINAAGSALLPTDSDPPLETEIADLRCRFVVLEERARLDARAQAFLRSDLRVREGDYCVIDGFPTRVSSISHEGKWTYFNGRNVIEPFRVPPSDDVQRLYTVAEVAEIIAKVRQEGSPVEAHAVEVPS
jgi:hypothetical protein